MINATEARANINKYEENIKAGVQAKVNELAETMSKSIKFHSENGFDCLQFCPYDKSRFTCAKTQEYAKEMFQKLFEDAGYTVIKNSCEENNLVIRW